MTNSRRARAIAAAIALLSGALCLWRDELWFQQVTAHQARPDLGSAVGINVCDPFVVDAFYHTPWNLLWPFLMINAAVIWMPGLIGYALSFGALALIGRQYLSWGWQIMLVGQMVASGRCGSELWDGAWPVWQDIAAFLLVLGLAGWRLGTAASVVLQKAKSAWVGA